LRLYQLLPTFDDSQRVAVSHCARVLRQHYRITDD
jgi:hypothetical protein